MIHRQFAQRRRLMAKERQFVVTLAGSFNSSSTYGARYVVINGSVITQPGEYTVDDNTKITLHTKVSPRMITMAAKGGIWINGTCVRSARTCVTSGPDYQYTVRGNCTITGQGTVNSARGTARIDVAE